MTYRQAAGVPARERIIVALDVPDYAALIALLDQLGPAPGFYKVGLELFVAEGARAIEAVKARGARVFLDLKLHDIPETVGRAVGSARRLGVDLLTVHTAGGHEMMARAAQAAEGALALLGVTVLTSFGENDLLADGHRDPLPDVVGRRARMARAAGLPGLVCSAQEVASLRATDADVLLVVPGIRPAGAGVGDQKRVGTPRSAIAAGADYLVVGRPVRDAADPAAAFAALEAEVNAALAARGRTAE